MKNRTIAIFTPSAKNKETSYKIINFYKITRIFVNPFGR